MDPSRRTLTSPEGPVVIAERTLRAMLAIRKVPLLAKLFGRVTAAQSVYDAVKRDVGELPEWVVPCPEQPMQSLPERIAGVSGTDAATLRLAIALPASLVLIDGPIKEKAKLSFIKCEGTVSVLVQAYREGHLSAVPPMVKALRSLGYQDVLPPPELLDALWKALDQLET